MFQPIFGNENLDPFKIFCKLDSFELIFNPLHILHIDDFIPWFEIQLFYRFLKCFDKGKLVQNFKRLTWFLLVFRWQIFIKFLTHHVTKLLLELINRLEMRMLLLCGINYDTNAIFFLWCNNKSNRKILFSFQVGFRVLFNKLNFKVAVVIFEFFIN